MNNGFMQKEGGGGGNLLLKVLTRNGINQCMLPND